ncbi:MAG: hypothetical protein JKP98_15295 [Rhodobacteraceae bacterium]|nr:hypothetical protein [Paracoccaceae bacterium]
MLAGLMRAGRVAVAADAWRRWSAFCPPRPNLAALAAQDRIAWVDVTAPGDGACFALCDPVAVSGVAPAAWPLVISAAFSQSLGHLETAASFACISSICTRCAYDYFAMQTLAERLRIHRPAAFAP